MSAPAPPDLHRRRLLEVAAQAATLAFAGELSAQPRSVRIGLLSVGNPEAAERMYIAVLREALRRRGWTEGRNLTFVTRYVGGDYRHLPTLAAELAAGHVDLIVATSTRAAFAAKEATSSIPIVFLSVQDPVEEGLVASLSRPGANLTGIAVNSSTVLPKRLELLKEAIPGLARVAMLYEIDEPSCAVSWDRLTQPAAVLGVEMRKIEIDRTHDYTRAFAAIEDGRAQALITPGNLLFLGDAPLIGELAARHRLPLVQQGAEGADPHSLFSYGPSLVDAFERAAFYVDRILRGADPATLPIEQPTRYELVLNRRAAHALGIRFPRSMLARADHLID